MKLGTEIALSKLMTRKTLQAWINSIPRAQHVATFAILSLALASGPKSLAQASKPVNSKFSGAVLSDSAKALSRDSKSPLKKDGLNFEQKIEKQIKLDLNRRESIGINGLRALGGDSSGGGNPEEVKFIATAVQIRNWLNLAPEFVKTHFGFEVEVLTKAIKETQISCASEPYLGYIREKSKKAFFIQPLKTVFLDCEKFGSLTVDTEAFRGVIFHEYMRSADIEGENSYQYSSQINWVITSAYEISMAPVYGNYLAVEPGESASVYYRGRIPFYWSKSKYGNEIYGYEVELKKESDGVWTGVGYVLEEFRMMPCYYPVRVRYQILHGYKERVAYVQVTLPASLPDRLDRNESTGKLTCPVPPIKNKSLTIVKQE